MLRDDVQVAINDVLVQCELNARHYRYSAEVLGDAGPVGLLNRLATTREGQVKQLRYQLRSRGDLPDAVDPERDVLHELHERIVARLAAKGIEALLRERIADEERLAATASAALDQPVSDEARTLLERLREDARGSVELLRREMG